jgi:hypothetical protein
LSTTTGTTMDDDAMDRLWKSVPAIHPGHLLLGGSLPFCFQAYRDYVKPLDGYTDPVVRKFADGYGDESARRAVGVVVASRALRVATFASLGVFGLCTAAAFYATGCTTTEQAVEQTRNWAHRARRRFDDLFKVVRIDRDHPDFRETLSLTEEQELEKYFPPQDYQDDDIDTRQ